MDAAALPPISHLIGPVVIAVIINSFVYGISVLQYVQYYLHNYEDPIAMRVLVNWCFLLDTSHTATALYMLWNYGITNFANLSILANAPWPFAATPIWTVLTSIPVQHLFAWRVKQFTHSWLIFGMLSFASIASGALGISGAILALADSDINDFSRLIPLADTWLALAVVVDMALALLLFYHLMRSRTGFKNTDNVIARLVHSSVETTAFTGVFCICDLSLFTAMKGTNFHFLFALPMGRVYSATLMATLNSRTSLREELAGTGPTFLGGNRLNQAFEIADRMKPTQVAIDVEQDIQMDSYMVSSQSRGSSPKKDLVDGDHNYSFTPM